MPDIWDIFDTNPAFTLGSMTAAMREVSYVPSYISQLGLFQVEAIDTLSVAIEKADKEALVLVPSSPRGSPGSTRDHAKRSMRSLRVPHFQRDDAIYADEVQGIRAFGTERQVETLQGKIARKAATHSQDFALTEEYHRLNIIKGGNLLDSDGSVLYNYATEFGESLPAEIDFDLDNASPADGILRERCANIYEAMGETLDGLPFSGIRAICGGTFFKQLIKHPEVRDTYKGYADAAMLRAGFVNSGALSNSSGLLGTFEFGDITWSWYRGGSNVSVDATKAHFVPVGVPGLFRTIYAPADYFETVNTMGQRLYAHQYESANGKLRHLEFQSNALHYCTRPRVLMRARNT